MVIDHIRRTSNGVSITYKPKRKKRKRVHGFRSRTRNKKGRKILARRRKKKRRRLTV